MSLEIRNVSRALILSGDSILCMQVRHLEDRWWILPGGGQEPGETLVEAAIRECCEELGQEISIQRLLFIREFIGPRHELVVGKVRERHFVEAYFLATSALTNSVAPLPLEANHEQIAWLDRAQLSDVEFYPRSLHRRLLELDSLEKVADLSFEYVGECE